MHDPMIVAFEIKSLIARKSRWFKKGYRNTLLTIWHVDPETDGTDNSCGWHAPKPSKADVKIIEDYANSEFEFYFGKKYKNVNMQSATTFEVVCAVWPFVRNLANPKIPQYRPISVRDLQQIIHLTTCCADNLSVSVKGAKESKYDFESLLHCCLQNYRRIHRPWYRHPRWHIHHWRLQIPALQRFLRWQFSRCMKCGGRFAYGERPVADWDHVGPSLLRKETGVRHMKCDDSMKPSVVAQVGKE